MTERGTTAGVPRVPRHLKRVHSTHGRRTIETAFSLVEPAFATVELARSLRGTIHGSTVTDGAK